MSLEKKVVQFLVDNKCKLVSVVPESASAIGGTAGSRIFNEAISSGSL